MARVGGDGGGFLEKTNPIIVFFLPIFFSSVQKKKKYSLVYSNIAMEDIEESSYTMVKEEPSFVTLDPSLAEVSFKDGLYPIEIHLIGEINSESASEFETKLQEAQRSGQSQIALIIQSEGGNIYDAMKIVDLILSSEVEVTTVVRGYAFSAASLIFSCGAERVMGEHASVMIHSVSVGAVGGTMAEIQVESEEMERLTKKMCLVMSENTNQRKDFYTKKLRGNRDVYLDAKEALAWNLATHIGDAKTETVVSVNTGIKLVTNKKRKRA